MVLFFFSSRRRHTRYWRDWSSDVCSSDLIKNMVNDRYWYRRLHRGPSANREPVGRPASSGEGELQNRPITQPKSRSEERRVGKECRSRWSAYHSKQSKKHMTGRNRVYDDS